MPSRVANDDFGLQKINGDTKNDDKTWIKTSFIFEANTMYLYQSWDEPVNMCYT